MILDFYLHLDACRSSFPVSGRSPKTVAPLLRFTRGTGLWIAASHSLGHTSDTQLEAGHPLPGTCPRVDRLERISFTPVSNRPS